MTTLGLSCGEQIHHNVVGLVNPAIEWYYGTTHQAIPQLSPSKKKWIDTLSHAASHACGVYLAFHLESWVSVFRQAQAQASVVPCSHQISPKHQRTQHTSIDHAPAHPPAHPPPTTYLYTPTHPRTQSFTSLTHPHTHAPTHYS